MSLSNNNIRLKVIGAFNDKSENEFFNCVDDYHIRDRVEFYSWLPFDEAFNHLQLADVGLIAFQPNLINNKYAMPHKLFDYMAAGLSVIIPRQALEVAPIVEKNRCGLLVDPSDSSDIANAFLQLYNNPLQSFEMGVRGYNAVISKYNWEVESKNLISAYNNYK